MTNEERVYAAEHALTAHSTFKKSEANEESLTDMLADLMHYAKHYEIDFDFALLNARMNFDAECSE